MKNYAGELTSCKTTAAPIADWRYRSGISNYTMQLAEVYPVAFAMTWMNATEASAASAIQKPIEPGSRNSDD
jgi:hypothetical protein